MRRGFSAAALFGFFLFFQTLQGAAPLQPEALDKAVNAALPLIEKSGLAYTKQRQCFACHHQALPLLVLAEAKKKGRDVSAESIQKLVQFTAESLKKGEKNYLKGQGQGGQADTAGYALLALEAGGRPPDALTDAVADYLLQYNKDLEFWQPSGNRPPTEASKFTSTYLALRGLQVFGTKAQQEKIEKRKDKVRPWVVATKPKDTEDHVFRLWALKSLAVDKKVLADAARELLRMQRPDGGWGQTPQLDSDAYATGSALVVLHQAGGLAVSDPAYQRGLKFLIDAQLPDGSWHVKSRSKPFQLYFESGFPHGKDQFISIAASSWAAIALLQAIPTAKGRGQGKETIPGGTDKENPAKPAAKPSFKEGDTFFQQLQVMQKPRFQVQGLAFPAHIEYAILSRLTIKKVKEDGGLEVEQKIEAVQCQADELSKPLVLAAAAKLQGAVFSITLNAKREVTQLKGVPGSAAFGPAQMAGGQGLQLISLLDHDGWKELTEATFFVPAEELRPGAKWTKKMSHSWGPLGHWAGQVIYGTAGAKDNLHRIDYLYQMQHVPPAGKPAGPVGNAVFQPLQAKGSILYAETKGKVLAVEEFFQVRGVLNIMLLGANTPVLIEEEQAFQIKIFDKNPAQK